MYARLPLLIILPCLLLTLSVPRLHAQQADINIATLLCLSGDCAEWGSNAFRGAQMALDEINGAGGVLGRRLALRSEDSGEAAGPSRAVTGYQKLRRLEGISFFVGPSWSPAGLALAPLVARDGVVMISPSLGIAQFNESSSNIFNIWPHDTEATRALAQYAFKRGWRRVSILSSQQPWEKTQGDCFADTFTELGGSVLIKLEPLPDANSVSTEVAKIKASAADFVFLSSFTQLATVAKEMQRLRINVPKLSTLMDKGRVAAADGALNNTIFAAYPAAEEEFSQRFFARYGVPAGISADTGYDSVKLLARAIGNAKSLDARAVSQQLLLLTHVGASGSIVFDRLGGVRKIPILYRVCGSAWCREFE